MSRYCHVEAGATTKGPMNLPRALGNISGIDHMDAAALKAIGQLSYSEVKPAFNPVTQILTNTDLASLETYFNTRYNLWQEI